MKNLSLVLCSLFLFSAVQAKTKKPFATTKIALGDVMMERKGVSEKVIMGANFRKGDVVSTGAKSLAIIRLKDGSQLKMNENSKLILNSPTKEGIELTGGSLFTKVAKKKRKKLFRIKTRGAVAGVRGTEFFTAYGNKEGKDDMWLCVNEGQVEVTDLTGKGNTAMVKAGEGISVRKGQGVSKPQPLAWTKKLNWNMSGEDLVNKVSIEEAYTDLLDQDYD